MYPFTLVGTVVFTLKMNFSSFANRFKFSFVVPVPSILLTVFSIPGSLGFGGVTGTSSVSFVVFVSSFKVRVALLGIVLSSYLLKSAPSLTLAVIARLSLFPASSANPSVISRLTSLVASSNDTFAFNASFGTPATVTFVPITFNTSSKSSVKFNLVYPVTFVGTSTQTL